MAVQIGSPAPDFALTSDEKKTVSLSEYKGKNVVLLFFPMAFTSVCTEELCMTRDDIASYQNLDAEIIAVSVDSPFTLAKFKEDQKLNYPLLSDFQAEVSTAYGALYEDFVLGLKNVSKRSAFVIDKDGVVQYAEVLENAGEMPDFAAVKTALEGLK